MNHIKVKQRNSCSNTNLREAFPNITIKYTVISAEMKKKLSCKPCITFINKKYFIPDHEKLRHNFYTICCLTFCNIP